MHYDIGNFTCFHTDVLQKTTAASSNKNPFFDQEFFGSGFPDATPSKVLPGVMYFPIIYCNQTISKSTAQAKYDTYICNEFSLFRMLSACVNPKVT
jgi:hypothetical protein